jgi:hypothetical protein
MVRYKGNLEVLKAIGADHLSEDVAKTYIGNLEQNAKKPLRFIGFAQVAIYFAELLTIAAYVLLLLFAWANMSVLIGT